MGKWRGGTLRGVQERQPKPASARRSPDPEERQRDAGRTRRRILDAAAREFAAHGLGGARVARIAQQAGVNQQLISYYFGGKQGLYDELTRQWSERERAIAPPDAAFADVVAGYIQETLSHPEWAQLLLRRGLDGELATDPGVTEALADIKRRQATGELDAEYDAGFILLVSTMVALAPVALPHVAAATLGDLTNQRSLSRFVAQAQRLFATTPRPRAAGRERSR